MTITKPIPPHIGLTVYFKSGSKLEISIEIGMIIRDRILEGAKQFQCFSDTNSEKVIMINLNEIEHIS